jgi:hypothetical protein
MSLAKELAKLKAALDAPWPEETWKAKAEIAERELSATKDEYCKTAFALTEYTGRAEKAEAEVARLKEELQLARLAPAPEEPAPDHFVDANKMIPDWRELGPNEVICEGDECYAQFHNLGSWHKADPWHIGHKSCKSNFSFRTRRPLPVQEMPLEDEIVRLQEVGRLNYAEGQQDLTDCLRYLRDEIEQLKKNQK